MRWISWQKQEKISQHSNPNDPNGGDPNNPNGGNMLVSGNEDAFIDEQDYSQPGFEEQEFDYQQSPDII